MNHVLVLNQDFSPITVCSVQRAFLLIFLKKAELVADIKTKSLRTISKSYPYPSVVRVSNYVRLPYKGVVMSRQNIFKRDQHSCQYCGTHHNLTIDHLIPLSKGGKSTWDNLVTACQSCNSRKGDLTPSKAGLTLKNKPDKPSYAAFLKSTYIHKNAIWEPYLNPKTKIYS